MSRFEEYSADQLRDILMDTRNPLHIQYMEACRRLALREDAEIKDARFAWVMKEMQAKRDESDGERERLHAEALAKFTAAMEEYYRQQKLSAAKSHEPAKKMDIEFVDKMVDHLAGLFLCRAALAKTTAALAQGAAAWKTLAADSKIDIIDLFTLGGIRMPDGSVVRLDKSAAPVRELARSMDSFGESPLHVLAPTPETKDALDSDVRDGFVPLRDLKVDLTADGLRRAQEESKKVAAGVASKHQPGKYERYMQAQQQPLVDELVRHHGEPCRGHAMAALESRNKINAEAMGAHVVDFIGNIYYAALLGRAYSSHQQQHQISSMPIDMQSVHSAAAAYLNMLGLDVMGNQNINRNSPGY